ncbi:MAG: hypothetical protein ACE15C_05455 [Phycisphaerae bacterium]
MHPWLRRIITGSLAILVGVGAALIAVPYVREHRQVSRVLEGMASDDGVTRTKAIWEAIAIARGSPSALKRFEKALPTESDRQFLSLVTVLRELGRFKEQDGRWHDRSDELDMEATLSPATRGIFVTRAVLSGRDNAYIRRMLERACGDASPAVRAKAALLAAKLGDDATLEKLLNDANPAVAGTAAIDAALARRTVLVPGIQRLLERSKATEAVSGAAYALAVLSPKESSKAICAWFARARAAAGSDRTAMRDWEVLGQRMADVLHPDDRPDFLAWRPWSGFGDMFYPATAWPALEGWLRLLGDEGLRDRLLAVMVMLNDEDARQAVASACGVGAAATGPAGAGETFSPAAAIWAAGKLNLEKADPMIRSVLALAAARDRSITLPQAFSAVQAADALKLPVRKEANDLCVNLWTDRPEFRRLLTAAAELLGRQTDLPQAGRTDAPDRAECIKTLQQAARYSENMPAPSPGDENAGNSATPVPSAAAAVALWELKAPLADDFVGEAAAEDALAGDYIAWRLAFGPRPSEAFDLGLKMLPSPRAATRYFGENEKSAGAMLLALSAKTPDQRKQAMDRITERLGTGQGDPLTMGSYRCALLILGDARQLEPAKGLLQSGSFPLRRVLTALLAAGDLDTMDWLLCSPQLTDDELANVLLADGMADVLPAVAPSLPRVDGAGEYDLTIWQIRILRDAYALSRGTLKLGLTR